MDDLKIEITKQNQRLLQNLNTNRHCECEIRQLIGEITGKKVADSSEIRLPFYTDFGQNIKIGKQVFINANAFFGDEAGIKIEDDVKIGPGVYLISKTSSASGQIIIKHGARIGAKSMILPGVTIKENTIVEPGSIVKTSR